MIPNCAVKRCNFLSCALEIIPEIEVNRGEILFIRIDRDDLPAFADNLLEKYGRQTGVSAEINNDLSRLQVSKFKILVCCYDRFANRWQKNGKSVEANHVMVARL